MTPHGAAGAIHKMTRSTSSTTRARRRSSASATCCAAGKIGDAIRVVVKKRGPTAASRKDILARSWQKGIFRRPDGSTIRFQENAAVLLKRDRSGPVRVTARRARVRQGKWMKIIMMASRVV